MNFFKNTLLGSGYAGLGIIPDVIRIGSLTKIFYIPGLQSGYVIADAVTIQNLHAWLPPWPSFTLALYLLPKLLSEVDGRDEQVVAARVRLIALLQQYDWAVQPSEASNFGASVS